MCHEQVLYVISRDYSRLTSITTLINKVAYFKLGSNLTLSLFLDREPIYYYVYHHSEFNIRVIWQVRLLVDFQTLPPPTNTSSKRDRNKVLGGLLARFQVGQVLQYSGFRPEGQFSYFLTVDFNYDQIQTNCELKESPCNFVLIPFGDTFMRLTRDWNQ